MKCRKPSVLQIEALILGLLIAGSLAAGIVDGIRWLVDAMR